MVPVGRGQRGLVAVRPAKTAIAIDAVNKNTDMVCIYVAIGQRRRLQLQTSASLFSRHGVLKPDRLRRL